MWTIFVTTLALIAVAELGDKTQFLALAMASRYSLRDVLGGIFLAVLILMGIAVLVGGYLLALLPDLILKIIAGVIFLFFGFYTLFEKEEKEGGEVKRKVSPFWTVFLAFFISELGDKTQILAMTLSAEYRQPLIVWLGASLAMVLVDGVMVFAGNSLKKVLAPKILRYVAGGLFLIFGFLTLLSIIFPNLAL